MIEAALKHTIDAAVGLSALVGTKRFWGDRQQGNEVPALVYRCMPSRDVTASGSLRETVVELIGLANTAPDSDAIAEAAATALFDATLNSNVGSTSHRYVGFTRTTKETLEPVPGEGEARQDAQTTVSLTLLYR